jgi:hypothetical protein
MHTDTIDPVFVFDKIGENKMLIVNLQIRSSLNFCKTPEFKSVKFTNARKERFGSETPNP